MVQGKPFLALDILSWSPNVYWWYSTPFFCFGWYLKVRMTLWCNFFDFFSTTVMSKSLATLLCCKTGYWIYETFFLLSTINDFNCYFFYLNVLLHSWRILPEKDRSKTCKCVWGWKWFLVGNDIWRWNGMEMHKWKFRVSELQFNKTKLI